MWCKAQSGMRLGRVQVASRTASNRGHGLLSTSTLVLNTLTQNYTKLKKEEFTMANISTISKDEIPVDTIWLDDGRKLEAVRPYQLYVVMISSINRVIDYLYCRLLPIICEHSGLCFVG